MAFWIHTIIAWISKYYKQQNKIIPSIGDIVNIYDDKVPRHKWLLGRIYDVITGKDGTIRGAKLFVGKTKKTVECPINKLFPVECFNEFNIAVEDENIRQQPRREAAILADIKRKFCNWHWYWFKKPLVHLRDISNRGGVLNFSCILVLTFIVM